MYNDPCGEHRAGIAFGERESDCRRCRSRRRGHPRADPSREPAEVALDDESLFARVTLDAIGREIGALVKWVSIQIRPG
jgi:hypothetical protein